MTDARVLKTFWRADRSRSLNITERGGLYSFTEYGEESDLGYKFWAPMSGGGLYETAEEAQSAAQAETPWLRDELQRLT